LKYLIFVLVACCLISCSTQKIVHSKPAPDPLTSSCLMANGYPAYWLEPNIGVTTARAFSLRWPVRTLVSVPGEADAPGFWLYDTAAQRLGLAFFRFYPQTKRPPAERAMCAQPGAEVQFVYRFTVTDKQQVSLVQSGTVSNLTADSITISLTGVDSTVVGAGVVKQGAYLGTIVAQSGGRKPQATVIPADRVGVLLQNILNNRSP